MLYAVIDAQREHLRRFLPWLDATYSRADVLAFRERVAQHESAGVGLVRVIERDNTLCGVVGFNEIDRLHRRASLGYWLDAAFEGAGLCTRSCRLLIDHGFSQLGLHRISLAAALANRRSRAVAERLGFRFEGVLREAEWLYDHFVDLAVYGLLHHEWSPGATKPE